MALWEKVEEDRKAVVVLDKNLLMTQLYESKLEDHGTVRGRGGLFCFFLSNCHSLFTGLTFLTCIV